jgi:hypothetical protein
MDSGNWSFFPALPSTSCGASSGTAEYAATRAVLHQMKARKYPASNHPFFFALDLPPIFFAFYF